MIDRWLANDWVLRVLSLLLAIGVWANLNLTQSPTTVMRKFRALPVTVQNTGRLKVQVTPEAVAVEIRGPSDIVDALQPSAIRVLTAVPYAQPGTYRVKLNVDAPVAGTEVIAVLPDKATVQLLSP